MAKASSPIRLQAELMQAATLSGKRYHRSTAEQVEYWADIGRQISAFINPDTLLSITSGLAKITVEPILAMPIDPTSVFQSLEDDRHAGTLSQSITTSAVRYQVSEEHSGYLVQIDRQNNEVTGQFKDGEFIALK